jgi:LPXTG-site transpeptidase (sortase) family protein
MDKFFTGLGISLLLFGSFLVYQRNNPNRIAFAKSELEIIEKESKKLLDPSIIIIPSVDIQLPVVFSEIRNSKWEVTDKGVSYLKSSVIPGEVGNSIMYGHNWTNLLGSLTKIKTGDTIEIVYVDNSKKEFVVKLIQEVEPDNISILNNTDDKRLTIYTCSGFLDSKRFIVVALLSE